MDRIDLAREPAFRLGDVTVDPARRTIADATGDERIVPPRAMQVLAALYRAGGGVLSRGELNQSCWDGRQTGNDAIERVVAQLRRLDLPGVTIETIPRVGYRLDLPAAMPVSAEPERTAPPRGWTRRAAFASGGLAVAGFALALWHRAPTPSKARARPLRLVVLPFDNFSADRAADFLAEGVSRQIRDQLSRVSGLRVIAEPSSRTIVARGGSVEAIMATLSVDLLIRGSVRESANRVRVAAELLGNDGAIAWSTAQAGASSDLFAVQDALSGAVLRQVIGLVGADHVNAAPVNRIRDSSAFRLVLEARQLLETSRAAQMRGDTAAAFDAADRAADLAQRGLRIDADDTGALLVLAELTRNGWTRAMAAEPRTADQRVASSIGYVTRALAVDPNDPAALTALGDYYRRFEWRWEEAETLFRKALAIDPSLAEAHWSYAYLLGVTGRALDGLGHAKALFDLDPETTWRRVALPRLLFLVGDRARTMARYDIELAATPANLFLVTEIYLIHLARHDTRAILALAEKVAALQGGRPLSPALGHLLDRLRAAVAALRGDPRLLLATVDADVAAFDSPAAIGAASRQGRLSIDYLYIYAIEYAWAGATEKALDLLERALAGHSVYWPATLPFGVTPFPPATRRHPRWRALWAGTPQLTDLLARRRRGLLAGQQAGYFPDGRWIGVSLSAIERVLRET